MSSLLPSPSNGYAVTVNFKISDEVWNAALPHLAGRVDELEAVVLAGYTAAQQAGTAMAEAIIQNAVAPQIADINETIAGFQTAIALAEDQLAALQNGGVQAVNVPLAPYGIFAPGTDAQEAFNFLSDAVEAFNEIIEQLGTEKMDKTARGAANGVAPLGADQKVPAVNLDGTTLKVGDILRSTRVSAPSGFLRADGAKYLKTAYPALAAVIGPSRLLDTYLTLTTGATSATVDRTRVGGDYFVSAGDNSIVVCNLKTNVVQLLTGASPLTTASICRDIFYNPDDGLFYILWTTSGTVTVRTLNPATGSFANVTHNLPNSTGAHGIAKINGFWYHSSAGTMYRGAALNSMAAIASLPGAQFWTPPAVHGDGTLYLYRNQTAAQIWKSTNNGVTWSQHESVVAGAISSFATQNVSSYPEYQAIFDWQGQVYFRAENSANSTGYLLRVNPSGASALIAQFQNLAAPSSSGLVRIGDEFILIGRSDPGERIVFDRGNNRVRNDDNLAFLGYPSGYRSENGLTAESTGYHPIYGIVGSNNQTTIDRIFSSHNVDTEFRVPYMPASSGGVYSYVKAVA